MTRLYKAKRGDTVDSICKQFGISWDQFAALNPDYSMFGWKHFGSPEPGEWLTVSVDPLKHLEKET